MKEQNRPVRSVGHRLKKRPRKIQNPVQHTASGDETGILETFRRSEAFWLLAASCLLYTIAFGVQKSYLAAHGIEAVFVETDIDRLLFTTSVMLGLAFFAWSTLGILPATVSRNFIATLYILWPTVLGLLILYWAFRYFGFAWGVLAFGLLATIFVVSEVLSAVQNFREGRGVWEQFEGRVSSDRKIDERMLRSRFFDKLPMELLVLLMMFLIAGQSIGPLVGRYAAGITTTYHRIAEDGRDYILVSEFQDGFVFVEIDDHDESANTARLTGDVVWISSSDLSGDSISVVELDSFVSGDPPLSREAPNRVSFEQLLVRLRFW